MSFSPEIVAGASASLSPMQKKKKKSRRNAGVPAPPEGIVGLKQVRTAAAHFGNSDRKLKGTLKLF